MSRARTVEERHTRWGNALFASLSSAFEQDGHDMNRHITQLVVGLLMCLPEMSEDPAKTLHHLSRTLEKASRYAETNLKGLDR